MSADSPSHHELPDDVNRWPGDPAAVLGVAADVSRRDLKRAYSRLIRRFKPEHAPEQFRRLREAFEQLDQQLEWRELFERHLAEQRGTEGDGDCEEGRAAGDQPRPAGDSSTLNVPIFWPLLGGDDSPAVDAADSRLTRPIISANEADQLWQQALDGGDLKVAYSRLVELAHQRPPSEIGFARLYWLLTIRPEFDASRDPSAWLIEGVRNHGLNNRLLPMLSNEVIRRLGNVPPVLADNLLDGSHTANRLVDLLQTRWFAARRLSRFDIVGADVERLRTRFLDEPVEWQRLLCGAVRQLVMVRGERAASMLAAVREELAGTPANVSSNWLWDSLEAMLALHESWLDQTRVTSSRMTMLVERTWECAPYQARPELMTMCVALTADMRASLEELTWIAKSARPLVRRLLELLYEQQAEFGGQEDSQITPAVEEELRRFVRGELFQNLESSEATVLNFCLREAVTPHDVAAAIEQQSEQLPDACVRLAGVLRNHLPMMCLVEAHRLLW